MYSLLARSNLFWAIAVLACLLLSACSPVVSETPEVYDAPALSIRLELSEEEPEQPWKTRALGIHLVPNVPVDELSLQVSLAGNIEAEDPAAFVPIPPIEPYIKNLQTGNNFETTVKGLVAGQVQSFRFPFRITEPGSGYILVSTMSPSIETGSSTLYVLATFDQVFFSQSGFLDLEVQKAESDLRRSGNLISEDQPSFAEPQDESIPIIDIESEIERVKRSGADVQKQLILPEDPDYQEPESEGNSITIQGKIAFTDLNSNVHPVRFSVVEIWDWNADRNHELVATIETDEDGFYTVTVDDIDSDGTGRDIYIVAKAEGEVVRIVDPSTGDPWAISSEDDRFHNLPDPATAIIDITATNDDARENQVTFEVYEAINYLARYLPELGEPLPRHVTVRYPVGGDADSHYRPNGETISLGDGDAHDWDNIHHEYGHHLQKVYGIAKNPAGYHNYRRNLCEEYDKDTGIRLAWGEAWPTAFAMIAQTELKLDALNIPYLGDLKYTDTKPTPPDLEYEIEQTQQDCCSGEGNELAIQRVIWDLYDDDNDGEDVSVPSKTLWEIIKNSQPRAFSDFWNALVSNRTDLERVTYGAVLSTHGIGTLLDEPADFNPDGNTPLKLKWSDDWTCESSDYSQYELYALRDTGIPALKVELQSETSFELLPNELLTLGNSLTWYVTSKDESPPETGTYYSNSYDLSLLAPAPSMEMSTAELQEDCLSFNTNDTRPC